MSSGGVVATEELYGCYLMISAVALCCYEHLITFGEEVKYVWRRRFTGGSVLFVLNRYGILLVLFTSIPEVVHWTTSFNSSDKSSSYWLTCELSVRLGDVCLVMVSIVYAVFAALRMYALYNMNKVVFVFVLFAGIVAPCMQAFIMSIEDVWIAVPSFSDEALRWRALTCHKDLGEGKPLKIANYDLLLPFNLALHVHALIFEILLVGLTWRKSLSQRTFVSSAFRAPLTVVLYRDGTLYFMVIAVVNVLNLAGIASSSTSNTSGITFVLYVMSPLVYLITSICMSRFLLNLLAAAEGDYNTQYESSRWNTVVRFAQVETLGAPLRDMPDSERNGVGNEDASRDYDTEQYEMDDRRLAQ